MPHAPARPSWSAIGDIAEGACDALPVVPLEARRALRALAGDPSVNDRFVAEQALFRQVELRQPAAAPPPEALRLAYWNLERCKYPAPTARLLRRVGPDVALLGEMDLGCARSGQAHTTRLLADALGLGYAYGVEFLELGLGDKRERAWHAAEENAVGCYGNAMVTRLPLRRPAMVTLDDTGIWFEEPTPRLGRQMVLVATVEIAGGPVTLASAHFDSEVPRLRAANMATLLDALERYAPGQPVALGGDFNTKTVDFRHMNDVAFKQRLLARDPERLLRPERYEPLFAIAAERGYDWQSCNVVAHTARQRPDGEPNPPFFRNDFFFLKGLLASAPGQVAAVDEEGTAISDHEMLVVTVRHR